MPGKVNQDWTDDAAFWDDAWTDMQQRLDDDENPKGFLLWTRGAVLFILLLLGATAAWFLSGDRSEAPASETIPESISVPAPNAPVASSSPAATANPFTEAKAPSAPTRTTPQATPPGPVVHVPAIDPPATKKVKAVIDFGNSAVSISPEPNLDQPQPSTDMANGNSTLAPAADQEDKLDAVVSIGERARIEPVALFALHSPPITKVPVLRGLPEVSVSKSKPSFPLFVEATGSLAQGGTTPGFTLGLGTLISPKGRIRFPISLRYRRDFMQLGKRTGGSNDEAIEGLPTADMVSNAIDPLRFTLGSQGTALTTSGLELFAGLQYRLMPRLHLTANTQLEGLLTANGVINATLNEENLEYLFNNRATANTDLTAGFGNITASNESSSGLSDNSAINRFRLRAGLQLNYQLTDGFSAMTGITRIMTPTYSGELLRVRPTQLVVGVQYRIK